MGINIPIVRGPESKFADIAAALQLPQFGIAPNQAQIQSIQHWFLIFVSHRAVYNSVDFQNSLSRQGLGIPILVAPAVQVHPFITSMETTFTALASSLERENNKSKQN